jgi:hypothetical protein
MNWPWEIYKPLKERADREEIKVTELVYRIVKEYLQIAGDIEPKPEPVAPFIDVRVPRCMEDIIEYPSVEEKLGELINYMNAIGKENVTAELREQGIFLFAIAEMKSHLGQQTKYLEIGALKNKFQSVAYLRDVQVRAYIRGKFNSMSRALTELRPPLPAEPENETTTTGVILKKERFASVDNLIESMGVTALIGPIKENLYPYVFIATETYMGTSLSRITFMYVDYDYAFEQCSDLYEKLAASHVTKFCWCKTDQEFIDLANGEGWQISIDDIKQEGN